MRPWTLRGKLLVIGGALVFLSLTVSGIFSAWKAASALRQNAEQAVISQSQGLADMVASVLDGEKWSARALASVEALTAASEKIAAHGPEAAQGEIEALNKELLLLLKNIGDNYEGVFVSDAAGSLYAGTTPDGKTDVYKGVKIAERPYFQKAKAPGTWLSVNR